jgi:hypothetical protein
MCPDIDWPTIEQEYDAESRGWSAALIERAVDRLTHGDITDTQYGIRVALRPDLGDNRESAGAYWPQGKRGCLCFAQKKDRECSHELAARLFLF